MFLLTCELCAGQHWLDSYPSSSPSPKAARSRTDSAGRSEAPNMRYRRKVRSECLFKWARRRWNCPLMLVFWKTFIGIPQYPMAIHPDPSAVLCTYGQRRRDGRYKSPEIPALGFFFFSSSPVKPSSLSLSLPLFVPPYQCPSLLVVVIASIILPGPTHYNTQSRYRMDESRQ